MALLLTQIGAAPPPPPRRWIYSGLYAAPYEEVEEPVRALATGWQHVTPAAEPTGRWVYTRTPVASLSEPDEWVRVSTSAGWHVSPAVPTVRFVAARSVRHVSEETDERMVPRWQVHHATGISGTVRGITVRGNHLSGFDDYEESWFG